MRADQHVPAGLGHAERAPFGAVQELGAVQADAVCLAQKAQFFGFVGAGRHFGHGHVERRFADDRPGHPQRGLDERRPDLLGEDAELFLTLANDGSATDRLVGVSASRNALGGFD